jgi:hypothetical protein
MRASRLTDSSYIGEDAIHLSSGERVFTSTTRNVLHARDLDHPKLESQKFLIILDPAFLILA